MPDLASYHSSISAELNATRDRIRHLVMHWPTDGAWKEAVLRTVLRRHLSTDTTVASGFVVGREYASTQIDLLILKPGKPALFREGELAIVTPDVPAALVEVKTQVTRQSYWNQIFLKLATIGEQCKRIGHNVPWLGVFVYDGTDQHVESILDALKDVYDRTGTAIDSVAIGSECFVRFWREGNRESEHEDPFGIARWRAYRLAGLAPSYFIGNLVDGLSGVDRHETDYAWFAYRQGKREYMIAERLV